jgi:hypothetical protein
MPKAKKAPEVKEFRDGEILKTNRLYIGLREVGQCNEKGKSVMSVGYRGKFIAKPDKPLQTLMMPLMDEIMKFMRYSDDKLAEEDIKAFKDWVNSIKLS